MSLWQTIRIFFRSLLIQASWNPERMLNLGYCFCLAPFAKSSLKTDKSKAAFLKRNLLFFNTHPYLANWILGAAVSLEAQAAKSKIDAHLVDRFRKTLSQSLAAIGDDLFWGVLRPLSAMAGVLVALHVDVWGVLTFLTLYNIPHLFVRVQGLIQGQRHGFKIVNHPWIRKYKKLGVHLNKLAGFLTGATITTIGLAGYAEGTGDVLLCFAGAGAMYLLLQLKISIPFALMIIGFGAVLVGSISAFGNGFLF